MLLALAVQCIVTGYDLTAGQSAKLSEQSSVLLLIPSETLPRDRALRTNVTELGRNNLRSLGRRVATVTPRDK